jgi:hypothetical protein
LPCGGDLRRDVLVRLSGYQTPQYWYTRTLTLGTDTEYEYEYEYE